MRTFLLFFAWPGGAVWGNVWAMPLCGAVAAVSAFLLRDRLGSAMRGWWRRHDIGHGHEIAEIRELAAKAHRIAADTYQHQTGKPHPDAPAAAVKPAR